MKSTRENANRKWTPQMKEINQMSLHVASRRFNWGDHMLHVYRVLEFVDKNYLTPEDFFKTYMPLQHVRYQTLKENRIPLSGYPFDVEQNEILFYKTLRYWFCFHFTPSHYIPPVLFGTFWLALAYRIPNRNDAFENTFRSLTEAIIRVTCSTQESSNHLFESGYEYMAVTGILSGVLRDLYFYHGESDFRREYLFLNFFKEMVGCSSFSWTKLFHTQENAKRFVFLLEHLIYKIAMDNTDASLYIKERKAQNEPISLEHICFLLSMHELLQTEFLKCLVALWSDLCVKQDFPTFRQSLPTNSGFFHRICARTGFKPTACAFTFCMAEDPFSKNEYGLVFFVLFDGFHPSLWLPCPLQHVRELTPNGMELDRAIWEFHSQNKHFFPVEAYSACKLMKQQRIEAILEKIKREQIPIHNLNKETPIPNAPWFDYELKLFFLLPREILHFVRSQHLEVLASSSSSALSLIPVDDSISMDYPFELI
jgi:hypothetical protein